MMKHPTLTPSYPTEPAGEEAVTEISHIQRSRVQALVKGILVKPAHADAVIRVYMALEPAARVSFLMLPVAEMIVYSDATLHRAQARANRRGSLLGRFRG